MNLNTDAIDRLEEIESRMESTLDVLKAIHADVDGQMKAEEEIRDEMAVEFEDMEDELQQAEELAEQYKAERDRLWKRLKTLEGNANLPKPEWFGDIDKDLLTSLDYQRDLVPPTDK